MPVFDHHVAAIRQLRFMTSALARQSRLRVRGGLVSVVAPLLTVEVHRRVARIIGWWRGRLILPLKALMARPSFDQRPVYTEVFVRKEVRYSRLGQHLLEEL